MTIDILMTTDDAYMHATVVAAHTLLKASRPTDRYRLFVITPPDAGPVHDRLLRHLERMHPNVECIHRRVTVEIQDALTRASHGCHLPSTAAYRLFAASLLPECDRCLYLDSDITVMQDLSALFEVDLEGNLLGAVKDSFCSMEGSFPQDHQAKIGISYDNAYFNSGVLVLDLAAMRAERVEERFAALFPHQYQYVDQDILNIVCKGRVRLLPLKYNVNCRELRSGVLAGRECFDPAQRAAVLAGDIAVLHYVGAEYNPWLFPQMDYARRWFSDAHDSLPPLDYQTVVARGEGYRKSIAFSSLLVRARQADSVIIYGFTRYARDCARRLRAAGVTTVEAFVDRNPAKWGMEYGGIVCVPPEDLPQRFHAGRTLIVIAAQSVYREVYDELIRAGYPADSLDRYFDKGGEYYRELAPEYLDDEREDMECIDIVMASDANYISQLAVAAHSLLLHADPRYRYRFHVLTPQDVRLEDDERIAAIRRRHANCEFLQVSVEPEQIEPFERAARSGVYAASTYYRLLMDELLPAINRCLYLDCDITVLGDIAPLAQWDLAGKAVAAVPDPVNGLQGRFSRQHEEVLGFAHDGTYFCAGVMVLDLQKLRASGVLRRAQDFDLGRFPFADQDALNILLRDEVRLLPLRYDVLAKEHAQGIIRRCGVYAEHELEEIDGGGICVFHYAGPEDKPWNLMDSAYARRWVEDARDILPEEHFAALEDAYRARIEQGSFDAIEKRCREASRVFIHGFTPVGRDLCRNLLRSGDVAIAGFLDANPEKTGLVSSGVACSDSAQVGALFQPGDLVVVCAQTAYRAIRKELLAAGLPPSAIDRYIPAPAPLVPKREVDVSVIIPVYNTGNYLDACLESVLAQTLQEVEVVCVDDASSDDCGLILAGYAARDARVRVITLPHNCGQGVARNEGMLDATGRYLYFLDSDDMLAPEALEELVKAADADALDGIFFDSQVVYDTPALAKRHASYPAGHTGTYPDAVVSGLELFEAFMAQRDWTCYVQRQFWRHSFLQERGILFPTWASHEDEAFAFEAILTAQRVRYLRKPYFIRRYREGSVMTSKPQLKNFASYFQGYCLMTRFVHDAGIRSKAADRNIARIYDALVRQHERLLADGVDVAARFEGTELLGEYLVFAAVQNAWMHHGMLSQDVLDRVRRAPSVYIYGAGVLARNVHAALVRDGQAIEGFLVTSMQGNPTALLGHRVYALADVPADEKALVVIAVTDGYRVEIELALDAAGWRHVYCKEGWLV